MAEDGASLRTRAVEAHRAGRREEALEAYTAYLTRAPGDAGFWSNLGALLRAEGQHDLAVAAQRRAYALAPDGPGIRNNLANILHDTGALEEALELRRALAAARPEEAEPAAMVGKTLRAMGRLEEGIAHLEEAARRFPDEPEMRLQLSLTQLAAGDYARGFANYRARWQTGELTARRIALPEWQGESLAGKRILVLPEQGFGDAVAFLRFLPVLQQYGPAEVVLSAERPVLRLLQGIEGADRIVEGVPEEGVDLWTNIMDLPALHFALTGEVPEPVALAIPEESRRRARALTQPFRERFRVGVVWTGSLTYRGNAFRSFSHTEFHPLLDVPGLQLISLYKGPRLAPFRADGTAAFIPDFGGSERDFADNAAMMKEMDLILTSDTATAHVAGSLGVPVWTLLHSDPFWLWRPEGEGTPWYPTMRLIRQAKPGDWGEVFARIRPELAALAARGR
ncbi:tetratricopeptide repeat protein [Pseudoroseicyclus sp. CXY001]|uniref:tetratricopeptide repeat protein n=1 Tax=Pseudoroseicyclus sp. CXY001 TaxID=3242492 RepID=UPI0035713561